jgi:hypothetical protein
VDAHVDRDLVPDDLAFYIAQIPDDAAAPLAPSFPVDWAALPVCEATWELGRSWVVENVTLAALVPSAIVPGEHNVRLS